MAIFNPAITVSLRTVLVKVNNYYIGYAWCKLDVDTEEEWNARGLTLIQQVLPYLSSWRSVCSLWPSRRPSSRRRSVSILFSHPPVLDRPASPTHRTTCLE